VIWDINEATLAGAKAELGRTGAVVHTLRVDIADPASVEAAVAGTLSAAGRLDILINNAAIVGPNATVANHPLDEWRKVIDVDVNGTFYCCRAVVPVMTGQKYGRIVNIASVAGKEVAGLDIAVNCVTPAVARTPGAMEQAPEHIQ
jgi:3-oxoacyl-[acyl-carrier protein] reductase